MATNKNQQTPIEESRTKTETFILANKKVISIVVIAVLVVVAGVILLNSLYLQPRQVDASTAIAKGQELFAQEQYEKALNGDGAGYAGFLKVIDEYGCTEAGNLAKLYAGLCYAQMGKYTEAESQLKDYSPAGDALVSPAAMAALGNVYASLNKLDDAVSTLKKAAKMANSESATGHNVSLAPQFLLQAGKILESQGKTAEALEIYQDIKKNYINSPVSREIDKYIERTTK